MLVLVHQVGRHEHPNRMSTYEEHVNKYDFSSLRFPLLSSVGSFAMKNNLSIDVYDVENDEKDMSIYYCVNVMAYNIILLLKALVG